MSGSEGRRIDEASSAATQLASTGGGGGGAPPSPHEGRYLVTLAMVPDEGSWCSFPTYGALCTKIQALWCLAEIALVYYVHSALGRATSVRIVSEEDFAVWYRGPHRQHSPKLIAHDRDRASHVQHSSGLCSVPNRLCVDVSTLESAGAAFCLKHPALDEVIFVGRDESLTWGNAIIRAQRSWNVMRPIFRYLDDGVAGERVVVTILTSEDFAVWVKRRLPLCPQLVVFEHATERRDEATGEEMAFDADTGAIITQSEKRQKHDAMVASALVTVTPLIVKNQFSLEEMAVHGMKMTRAEKHALSSAAGPQAHNAASHHYQRLAAKLQRLQDIEATAAASARPKQQQYL